MLLSLTFAVCSVAITVTVSPQGDDSWPGTTEKPLRTLHAAQRKEPRTGKTVELMSGVYELDSPLFLTPEDNGSTWKAKEGHSPILSGAKTLKLDWQKGEDNKYFADVELSDEFGLLYADGERLSLARYPNFDKAQRFYGGTAPDAISKERIARWKNPVGARVHGLHTAEWGGMHYKISGVDKNGEAILEGGWQNNRSSGLHKDRRFVENVFEELDTGGEWFYDKEIKRLWLIPNEGMDLSKTNFAFTQMPHLIELQGSMEIPVKNITVSGLKLTRTTPTYWQTKEPLLRSDWTIYRGGAIFATGVEDCKFDLINIDDVGGNGIFFSGYAKRCAVTRTRITNAGANGICFVGSPSAVRTPSFNYNETHEFANIDLTPGSKTDEFPEDCTVEDSLIFDFGWLEKQVAGVQISMSSSITVRSCSIYDCPRSGINVSEGTWGGHLIEFCDVFDTVLETGDHGSFNSWGRDRFWHPDRSWTDDVIEKIPHMMLLDAIETTILRNNRWRCDRGWDIDLDDGSSNYILENNLCLRGGIKLREGYKRIVRNNITVNNGFHPHVWYKNSSDIVERNIFSTGHRPIRVGDRWGDNIGYNLYALSEWPTSGQELSEQTSIIADPMFRDPASGDYTPKLESPAYQLGFKSFAMDRFGVQYQPLKSEARTPVFPPYTDPVIDTVETSEVLNWLGGQIKSMGGIEEASAYGARPRVGVIVISAPETSELFRLGFKERDVVIKLDNQLFNSAKNLLKEWAIMSKGTAVRLIRGQEDITLVIESPF